MEQSPDITLARTRSNRAPPPVEEKVITSDQSSTISQTGKQTSGFNPGWRFYLAFASLSTITLMAALDATSISVALPIMARLLNGSAIEAFWAGTSFLLTSTVFQPIIGSFSHIFGRKLLIYISLALFGAGVIVAAVADNFTVILVGRSVQGIGGGGIICLTEMTVTDMVPLRERGKWFSFLSSMWAIGTVTGPLLGGGFSQNVTWRWIFWINLPFIGIGLAMIILFLNLHQQTSSFLAKLRRVDWLGMVLFLSSSTGFLIPITWGGVQYAWSSWRTLVPLILCSIGMLLFVLYEAKLASEPLIRLSVFSNRTANINFSASFIHGLILWCVLYYLPLYYEAVKGYTPILAGVSLFPQTFTVAPAATITGAAIAITGRYRWALWSGWFLTVFGLGLLTYLKTSTSTPAWVFINLVSGLGTGILFPAMSLAIQAASSNADQAYAVNMFSFVRAFGQTVGVAIGGVIFQNQMRRKMLAFPQLAPFASEYSRDASGLVQILKQMPEGQFKHDLRVSYTDGLRYVWIVMAVLAGLVMVANLFVEGLALDRALETEQGFKHEVKERDEEGGEKK
ncbi:MFS general substrate transporter [Patellaria atrata CBS 101060]|uniref:MFS general substrate transporter n=1 Tax=Patellaria atrata CBS 101060 TaxID=1346257 RepID=A0A9P4S5C7_9PEZI|nr:MFS general substrate transporter [Patellaria atrata CBS 101060]